MGGAIELSDVHNIVLIFENSGLVVVDIEVIWCTKDGHDAGETSCPSLPIHSVTGVLGLVCADD